MEAHRYYSIRECLTPIVVLLLNIPFKNAQKTISKSGSPLIQLTNSGLATSIPRKIYKFLYAFQNFGSECLNQRLSIMVSYDT